LTLQVLTENRKISAIVGGPRMGAAPRIYHFGEFTLDDADRQLLHDSHEVFLRPKAFDTLLCLVERRGHLVTKDELLDRVWHGTSVSDAVLTH
jgi:DNA-binding winged helix-turn-helix (wHTH) protein